MPKRKEKNQESENLETNYHSDTKYSRINTGIFQELEWYKKWRGFEKDWVNFRRLKCAPL